MQASYNRFLRSVTGNMVMCYVEGECVLKKCWWVDYNQDSMFLGATGISACQPPQSSLLCWSPAMTVQIKRAGESIKIPWLRLKVWGWFEGSLLRQLWFTRHMRCSQIRCCPMPRTTCKWDSHECYFVGFNVAFKFIQPLSQN